MQLLIVLRSSNLRNHSLNGGNILKNLLDVGANVLGQSLELEIDLTEVSVLVVALVTLHRAWDQSIRPKKYDNNFLLQS